MGDVTPVMGRDVDAAVEVFCEWVLFQFNRMSAEDRDTYRAYWRPTVEAILRAALGRETGGSE